MNDIPRIPFILNSNVLLYCIKCRLMLQMQRISNECFFLWFLCVIVDVYDLINLWGILPSTGLSSKECLFQFLKLIHLICFNLHYRELYEIRSLLYENSWLRIAFTIRLSLWFYGAPYNLHPCWLRNVKAN